MCDGECDVAPNAHELSSVELFLDKLSAASSSGNLNTKIIGIACETILVALV